MSKQTSLFLTQQIINTGQTFTSGDALVNRIVASAGVDDSIIKSINVHSTSSIPVQMVFSIFSTITASGYPIVTVPIGAFAGSGIAPSVDVFATSGIPSLPLDNAGKRYYPIGSGVQIRAMCMNNPSSVGAINVTSIIENY
jgi:hypothetical protein